MAKTNFAAISRVTVREASAIFTRGRAVSEIAADLAVEALKVLHDGLSSPDDKLRFMSANAIVTAHVKLASVTSSNTQTAEALPAEERIARLTEALANPEAELREAMQRAQLARVMPEEPER